MILDARNKTQKHLFPCRVFDAYGREIMFAVRIDTDTGEVEKRKVNKFGMFYQDLLKPRVWDGTRYLWQAATEIVKYPAPLRVQPGAPTFKV